jgi:hypothetical protein
MDKSVVVHIGNKPGIGKHGIGKHGIDSSEQQQADVSHSLPTVLTQGHSSKPKPGTSAPAASGSLIIRLPKLSLLRPRSKPNVVQAPASSQPTMPLADQAPLGKSDSFPLASGLGPSHLSAVPSKRPTNVEVASLHQPGLGLGNHPSADVDCTFATAGQASASVMTTQLSLGHADQSLSCADDAGKLVHSALGNNIPFGSPHHLMQTTYEDDQPLVSSQSAGPPVNQLLLDAPFAASTGYHGQLVLANQKDGELVANQSDSVLRGVFIPEAARLEAHARGIDLDTSDPQHLHNGLLQVLQQLHDCRGAVQALFGDGLSPTSDAPLTVERIKGKSMAGEDLEVYRFTYNQRHFFLPVDGVYLLAGEWLPGCESKVCSYPLFVCLAKNLGRELCFYCICFM